MSEGTTRQTSIRERAAKLQQEATALQAKILEHFDHQGMHAYVDLAIDEEEDELTA